jgi:putative ABC transport system substrate-binding protein
MAIYMRRREFIATLVGAVAAWPLSARAQPAERARRVGVLMGLPESDPEVTVWLSAFLDGLQQAGWAEGRNLKIEYRWSGDVRSIPTDAAELVKSAPEVILVRGSTSLDALRRATSTVPIIFVGVSDPVGQGVVTSLAHPGGNITGFANHERTVPTKLLGLLKEIEPKLSRVMIVHYPSHPLAPVYLRLMEASALVLKLRLSDAPVRNADEIEAAITPFAREPNGGLVVMQDNVTNFHRKLLIGLAARNRLPAVYQSRYFTEDGGLASYGSVFMDQFRGAATYVDRVLRGARPADLPIQQPTKFELLLNLKTAKALGLDVPPTLLARVDEVIE